MSLSNQLWCQLVSLVVTIAMNLHIGTYMFAHNYSPILALVLMIANSAINTIPLTWAFEWLLSLGEKQ